MRLRPYRELSVGKSGNRAGENEDAKRGSIPEAQRFRASIHEARYRPARFALADGATEAAFAKKWAELLVDRFVDYEPMDLANLSGASFDDWLEPCRVEWGRHVQSRDIPWHGLPKVRTGSLATFLGVTFWEDPAREALRWRAVAVGDCCLFIVRGGCLETAFPTQDPGDFGNMPALTCSNRSYPVAEEHIQRREGTCQRGDLLVLATDAMACWILTQHRNDVDPWAQLEDMFHKTAEGRELWVAEQRTNGSLRNDDATLLATSVS